MLLSPAYQSTYTAHIPPEKALKVTIMNRLLVYQILLYFTVGAQHTGHNLLNNIKLISDMKHFVLHYHVQNPRPVPGLVSIIPGLGLVSFIDKDFDMGVHEDRAAGETPS